MTSPTLNSIPEDLRKTLTNIIRYHVAFDDVDSYGFDRGSTVKVCKNEVSIYEACNRIIFNPGDYQTILEFIDRAIDVILKEKNDKHSR